MTKTTILIVDDKPDSQYNRKSDEVRGDAFVSESKTLSPDKNDVNIAMNLVYVPVWEIQGERNSIEINA